MYIHEDELSSENAQMMNETMKSSSLHGYKGKTGGNKTGGGSLSCLAHFFLRHREEQA